MKTCKVCKKTKPITEFRLAKKSSTARRHDCRSCENKKISKYQVWKNAEKNPQKYMGCNACDSIMSKYRIVSADPKCIYCGSNHLEQY